MNCPVIYLSHSRSLFLSLSSLQSCQSSLLFSLTFYWHMVEGVSVDAITNLVAFCISCLLLPFLLLLQSCLHLVQLVAFHLDNPSLYIYSLQWFSVFACNVLTNNILHIIFYFWIQISYHWIVIVSFSICNVSISVSFEVHNSWNGRDTESKPCRSRENRNTEIDKQIAGENQERC